MSEFRNKSIEERLNGDGMAGDPAEDAFRRWRTDLGETESVDYTFTGHHKVSTQKGLVATMAPGYQHTPDFISLGGHVWDCQGWRSKFGVIRFKQEKLEAFWKYHVPMLKPGQQFRFFLYDSDTDRFLLCTLESVLAFVQDPRTKIEKLDGWKTTFAVPAAVIMERLVADAFGYEKKLRKEWFAALSEEQRTGQRSTAVMLARLGYPVDGYSAAQAETDTEVAA